jgi:hypothetical protein
MNYCLTRQNNQAAWDITNTQPILRKDLRRRRPK